MGAAISRVLEFSKLEEVPELQIRLRNNLILGASMELEVDFYSLRYRQVYLNMGSTSASIRADNHRCIREVFQEMVNNKISTTIRAPLLKEIQEGRISTWVETRQTIHT